MNDHQFFKRWETIKEKGRFNYALNQGIKYGFFLTIFLNLMSMFQNNLSFAQTFLNPAIVFQLLVFTIFGMLLFGTLMWWLYNYLYNKRS